jgi:hypothetical protein
VSAGRRPAIALLVPAIVVLLTPVDGRQPAAAGPAPVADMAFTDATRAAGLVFTHVSGASARKHLAETMGSGAVLLDYDNDGWLDVLLVDGGSIEDPDVAATARHRLFRNRRDGTFEDVSARSGIRHRAYGMGACAGDYDNDGHVDLYITGVGANVLYRNRGDGSFTDVTGRARVGATTWSTSCAFADLDSDGDLDLFVTSYLRPGPEEPFCGNARLRVRSYCHPLLFEPLPGVLYRNGGNGVFADVSAETGIAAHAGYGLGVVIADFDDDGRPDVFVANDSVPNFLFFNEGGWRFTEAALAAGVAVAPDGRPRAGMGTDAADYDGDGRLDLVVTNHEFETHGLYRNAGGRLFTYATTESGIGPPTLPFVGFGVAFLDADNDTNLDLAIVNGHVTDNIGRLRSGARHAQRNLLFHNTGSRRLVEVGATAGDSFAIERVSRGLAVGDVDNDGDLDLLVTNNGGPVDLLLNQSPAGTHALTVRLIGRESNRDAVGARVRVTVAGRTLVREVKAGSSYLGQSDLRLHFGLGRATVVDRLDVRWPSGQSSGFSSLPADRIVTVTEGVARVESVAFARKAPR